MGNGRLRHPHQRDELGNVERGLGEQPEDSQAGGIAESAEGLGEDLHIVQCTYIDSIPLPRPSRRSGTRGGAASTQVGLDEVGPRASKSARRDSQNYMQIVREHSKLKGRPPAAQRAMAFPLDRQPTQPRTTATEPGGDAPPSGSDPGPSESPL